MRSRNFIHCANSLVTSNGRNHLQNRNADTCCKVCLSEQCPFQSRPPERTSHKYSSLIHGLKTWPPLTQRRTVLRRQPEVISEQAEQAEGKHDRDEKEEEDLQSMHGVDTRRWRFLRRDTRTVEWKGGRVHSFLSEAEERSKKATWSNVQLLVEMRVNWLRKENEKILETEEGKKEGSIRDNVMWRGQTDWENPSDKTWFSCHGSHLIDF